jgi:hypothetical protein
MRRNVATDAGLKSTVRDMTNSLEEMIKVKKYKREGDCPLIEGGRRLAHTKGEPRRARVT